MLVVAGLSLKNLQPRVWDPTSPHYLPSLRAVMVSYADFHTNSTRRRSAMTVGLHRYLGVADSIPIYLDNGAFAIYRRGGETSHQDYQEFVEHARPDWYPIPQDVIPGPHMTLTEQRACLRQTMSFNRAYYHGRYVPVIHVSRIVNEYIAAIVEDSHLCVKSDIAIGGIVPNLLRTSKAQPYEDVLDGIISARAAFPGQQLHLFGVGGTATLHIAALTGFNSLDSSGWRNRAARGIVQILGSGDRMVANLGSWRGRTLAEEEWWRLSQCPCPACSLTGIVGLHSRGIQGFCNRATHNLWTLLEEARLVKSNLMNGTYRCWYGGHLVNSIYRPLVDWLLERIDV